MKRGYGIYQSPIGPILVVADEVGVKRIELFEEDWQVYLDRHPELEEDSKLCEAAIMQLDEYFQGKRVTFTVPLSIEATPFRQQVWHALEQIPYGETRSYADIAEAIGKPKAVRAVGQANRANALPIIIPCHRVIGKNGSLVGYAGSRTGVKEELLALERGNSVT
ncbi:methylated-DNA--[protein]-cysteine S-methyltransferase [Bacillus marinisedimentorum]|uniref:methylated-DNA--[protein]-cysteine S-methyltransferase n=1 Tax=Bacillus marinisedimentorum TaxID=1821260 RepID=UPI000872EA10|nr:methylated-DNA--[protein]-cysteine S-methyltransferase [Bacillus marinisedimentorum]